MWTCEHVNMWTFKYMWTFSKWDKNVNAYIIYHLPDARARCQMQDRKKCDRIYLRSDFQNNFFLVIRSLQWGEKLTKGTPRGPTLGSGQNAKSFSHFFIFFFLRTYRSSVCRNVNAYICVHIFKNGQIEVHRHILTLDCRYGKTERNVSADRNVNAYRMLNAADINMSKCSNVQMFKCSNVQMFKCSNVQMFNGDARERGETGSRLRGKSLGSTTLTRECDRIYLRSHFQNRIFPIIRSHSGGGNMTKGHPNGPLWDPCRRIYPLWETPTFSI